MNSVSAEALHQMWADAKTLANFAEDRAQRQCHAPPSLERETSSFDQQSPWVRLSVALQFVGELARARAHAQAETLRDLAAGRLVGLGLRFGSQELEEIRFSLWPGAKVDWLHGVMSRGRTRFREIRVVEPDAIALIRSEIQTGPEMPHEDKVICAAIAENDSTEVSGSEECSALTVAAPRTSDQAKAAKLSTVDVPMLPEPARADSKSASRAGKASNVGRPNRRDEIRRVVEELWRDPLFRAIPNRINQAREVRARLCGESARYVDDMQGRRSSTIQRIIGEVANQSLGSDKTA